MFYKVGIYLVMSRVSGKGAVKVLVAGLGWGFAELVLTRLVSKFYLLMNINLFYVNQVNFLKKKLLLVAALIYNVLGLPLGGG